MGDEFPWLERACSNAAHFSILLCLAAPDSVCGSSTPSPRPDYNAPGK